MVRRDMIENFAGAYTHDGLRVWARPTVRSGLEKIALALMRTRAVANRVPLAALPSNSEYDIPSDIRHLVDPLGREQSISAADVALLRTRYIHWSSHYGRVEGVHPDALDGERAVIAPHGPAPGERRIVHPNIPSRAL